ncbi:hypothetical protein COU57_05440 [Candidatus Pacearchaeota archaeon CG10_big_fil_rev_8_21_14_0_10_32_14]|nr:MAG: hypothetical protein COU57_05440 [Candidatus Pacearchaeota archaeon CG10_big_fil_rev_8_21_14_0_10_32_14]
MKPRYSFSSRRTGHIGNMKKQRPKYPDLLVKVVNESDVLIEVLDIRFVKEMQNPDAEGWIVKQKKPLILVFNKTDLLDKKELGDKIVELESMRPFLFISTKSRRGISVLRDAIKRETLKVGKEYTRVGVIGYPNTGKSSLVNVLVGKHSAGTGAEAGFTKGIQKLKLMQGVVLLDSPGVIPPKEYSTIDQSKQSKDATYGARSYNKVKYPDDVVNDIMKNYPGVVEKHYEIKEIGDVGIILEDVGRKKGFMKKGGEVNEDMTARSILKDWQEGRIKVK